jgi:hypothetical protein
MLDSVLVAGAILLGAVMLGRQQRRRWAEADRRAQSKALEARSLFVEGFEVHFPAMKARVRHADGIPWQFGRGLAIWHLRRIEGGRWQFMWTHSSWLKESFHWEMQVRMEESAGRPEDGMKEFQKFRPDNWGGSWHDMPGHKALIEPAYQEFIASVARAPSMITLDRGLINKWESEEQIEKEEYASKAVAKLGEDARPAPGTY